MDKKVMHFGGLAVAGALLAGVCLFSVPASADVAAAEATFKAKCAGCHAADGKGKMPPYKTMSADQVKDMVAFIRSLKK